MSEFAYSLTQAAPRVSKYQIGVTGFQTTAGIPALIPAGDTGGLAIGTTTSAADFVGMTLDTVTYTTTQGTGANSAERLVSIIIDPNAVWSSNLSGGATAGTALTLQTVTTASAGGTAVTTGATWASPEYDEGVVWGYQGANAGQERKLTSTSATAGTVTVPFDNAIAVGDTFLRFGGWPFSVGLTLTSNLAEVRADIATATGAAYKVVELVLRDIGEEGTLRSKVRFMADDHALAGRPT